MERKKLKGIMYICEVFFAAGSRKADSLTNQSYILGSDGNCYRVSDKEDLSFLIKEDIKWGEQEGLPVEFETPVKKTGKYRWAYRIRKDPRACKYK